MNRFTPISLWLLLLLCNIQVYARQHAYPFEAEISGKGKQVLVLIPGLGCSGEVWKETRAIYEKQFTCYTLTMAGFAGVPAQQEISFVYWEKAIADYLTSQKISQAVIIGHSLGGGLAMALAADYPQLVSKIVVVDALPCLAATHDPGFKASVNTDDSAVVAMLASLTEKDFYQSQKQTITYLLADTSMQEMVVQWSVRSDRLTFARMYADFMNTDLRDKIGKVRCPALVLLEPGFAGIRPVIEKQFGKMKTAELKYATKGLHFIMYDDREWYLKQLASFLK